MKKIIALAAMIGVSLVGALSVTTPASAACQPKPKPGQYGGTGCFSVESGRAAGRA